jgi:hypothetical protein
MTAPSSMDGMRPLDWVEGSAERADGSRATPSRVSESDEVRFAEAGRGVERANEILKTSAAFRAGGTHLRLLPRHARGGSEA